jgi:hypothetical protein
MRKLRPLAQATTQRQEQENKMKTQKDIIKTVSKMYVMATGNTDYEPLARFILTEHYGVETFFLNKECDYSSGINLVSVQIFSNNMDKVIQAVNGEL